MLFWCKGNQAVFKIVLQQTLCSSSRFWTCRCLWFPFTFTLPVLKQTAQFTPRDTKWDAVRPLIPQQPIESFVTGDPAVTSRLEFFLAGLFGQKKVLFLFLGHVDRWGWTGVTSAGEPGIFHSNRTDEQLMFQSPGLSLQPGKGSSYISALGQFNEVWGAGSLFWITLFKGPKPYTLHTYFFCVIVFKRLKEKTPS